MVTEKNKVKLFIIRHGETIGNNDDLLQGHKDGLLSPKGYRQAESLAQTLQNEKVDVIYSSDLARGFETAQIIAKPHGIPVKKTSEIRERCFGIFEGESRTKFYSTERALPNPFEYKPEKGESFTDLYQRAKKFLSSIIPLHLGQTIFLIAHGDFGRMCLGVLLDQQVADAAQIHQTNACINILEVDENGKTISSVLNQTSHLPKELMSVNKSAL